MIEWLRYWYESDNSPAHRFRYGLLAFDILTVVFVVASSFTRDAWWVELLDVAFGLVILADFAARLAISRQRLRDLLHPATWADAVAILSFLAPLAGEAGGFLRVLRTLRLLQTYQLLSRLRADSPWFRRNEELAFAVVHLVVFLFVMTGIVYETQHWTNPEIRNYVDARLSIAEFLLPLLVLTMVLQYSGQLNLASGLMSTTLLVVLVDTSWLLFRLKRQLRQKFPDESMRGTTFYTIMRVIQLRWLRMPKPQVKVGGAPK